MKKARNSLIALFIIFILLILSFITGMNYKNNTLDTEVFSMHIPNNWKVSREENLSGIKCLVILPREVDKIENITNIDITDSNYAVITALYSKTDMVDSVAFINDKIEADRSRYSLLDEPIIKNSSTDNLDIHTVEYKFNLNTDIEVTHSIASGKTSTGTFIVESISSNNNLNTDIIKIISSINKSNGKKSNIGTEKFIESIQDTPDILAEEAINNISFFKLNNMELAKCRLINNDTEYSVIIPFYDNLYWSDNGNSVLVSNNSLSLSVQSELIQNNTEHRIEDYIDIIKNQLIYSGVKVDLSKHKVTINDDWSYSALNYNMNNSDYCYYIFYKQVDDLYIIYRIDINTSKLTESDKELIKYLVDNNIAKTEESTNEH